MSERFITSTLNRKDGSSDNQLRPSRFADFPGQDDGKDPDDSDQDQDKKD